MVEMTHRYSCFTFIPTLHKSAKKQTYTTLQSVRSDR